MACWTGGGETGLEAKGGGSRVQARPFRWRSWRLVAALLLGLSAPGAWAETVQLGATAPGVNDPLCRTMALPMVYAITLAVAFGTFAGLILVKRRLRKEGWSLANALSEPTRLTLPVDARWTDATRDGLTIDSSATASRKVLRDSTGRAVAVTMLEASSSRMIATLGGLGILMLYMGFGTFALYSFGLTCQLPASMTAVTTFLMSGLSLFAPYVANKVSAALQPGIRGGNPPSHSPDHSPQEAAPAPEQPLSPSPVLGGRADPLTPVVPSDAMVSRASAPFTASRSAPPPPAEPPPPAPPPPAAVTPAAVPPAAVRPPASSAPLTAPAAPPTAESPAYAAALELIRTFEGFVDHAYPDPASGGEPWTIGYGFTTLAGQPVRQGETISRSQAETELRRQVADLDHQLAGTIPHWREMTSNQRCALLDFAWNLGAEFYGDSADFATISRALRNRDWGQVPSALLLYCDPGTAVEAGLRRRRQAEADLWCQPEASGAAPSASRSVAAPFPNPLRVPYADQLAMADGQGWRECFSASSAMLAMYWGKEPNENVYDTLRARYGDSTSSEAQLGALRSLGLQADFRTDGSPAMLKAEIDAGRPVAVGWLCDGPVSSPSGGGHWSVIIGYDATGFFIHDPYGNCDLVNGGYLSHDDGAGLHYSSANWLPRWQVGGSGGWLLTCRP
ncbi:MAG: C39 family peptidase [Cyanobacteriota bacterium]|nr:C39 family peptidase [Cyanobacteriota bacterium]